MSSQYIKNIPIDNNVAERAIRSFCVGKKN
ncbi:MAG: transposase [Eubacterium sp.]|nr:transposase [Eubacterium sp.]